MFMRTDSELKQDVMDELKWEPMINETAIDVAVKDGVVILSGYTDSLIEKINAERAAESVFGVRGVIQKIEVKLPGASQRTDEEITKFATDALTWTAYVPDKNITVKAQNGLVTLTGEVEWNYQKDAAANAVCCLLGVKGVSNLITVKTALKPEDVEKKIENAFQRHAILDVRRGLKVKTQGDKAILSGVVHSFAYRLEAEQAALSAPGIREVENDIVVAP
jgi:osmotically-inducible protein OsmY